MRPAAELARDEVHEVRRDAGRVGGALGKGLRPGPPGRLSRDEAPLLHGREDLITPGSRVGPRPREQPVGSLDRAGQQGHLVDLEIAYALAEEMASGSRQSIDRDVRILAQVDGVEIALQDAALRVSDFEHEGDDSLLQLAGPGASRLQEQRSRQLLSDGAAALAALA